MNDKTEIIQQKMDRVFNIERWPALMNEITNTHDRQVVTFNAEPILFVFNLEGTLIGHTTRDLHYHCLNG